MFVSNRLRVIDENIEVPKENQEKVSRITLDEGFMQAIVSKRSDCGYRCINKINQY